MDHNPRFRHLPVERNPGRRDLPVNVIRATGMYPVPGPGKSVVIANAPAPDGGRAGVRGASLSDAGPSLSTFHKVVKIMTTKTTETKTNSGNSPPGLIPDISPVATVTGLYRSTPSRFEPLTKEAPLTLEEVRNYPVFYELELAPEADDSDLIVDVSYDNMEPVRMPDLFRGTDIPRGVRFWPAWFEIPPYREMRDLSGRRVYPRAPGVHTVRIRTARRLRSQHRRERDFSAANRGYTSPVFTLAIAADENGEPEAVPGTGSSS